MFHVMETFIEGDFEKIDIEAGEQEDMQREFESSISWDERDEDAFPVLVYYRDDEPVALIDLELGYAYVPTEDAGE